MKKLALVLLSCMYLVLFIGCSTEVNDLTTKTGIEETPVVEKNNSGVEDSGENDKRMTFTLYFTNDDGSALVKEKREIAVTEGAVMRAAVEALLEGPKAAGHNKTIPDGTRLLGIKRDNDTAVADFSKEFGSVDKNLLQRVSVVNTLTEISGIEKVRILVEGKSITDVNSKPLGDMKRFALDEKGRPVSGEAKKLTLYFGSPNADAVVAEKREVVADGKKSMENIIIEELIKGPKTEGLYSTIPQGTKLLSVETTKEGTCRLNLSKEFVDNASGGSAGEGITLNSIVNSLTELSNVKRVQFLIEGKVREVYTHVEFSEPFERNESSIKR